MRVIDVRNINIFDRKKNKNKTATTRKTHNTKDRIHYKLCNEVCPEKELFRTT